MVLTFAAAESWSARRGMSIISTRANGARHLALGIAAARRFAFVVQLLSLPQRQCHFRHSPAEVKLEYHERESLPLDGSDETTDFLAMEQQLARSLRFVIRVTAALVRSDVHVDEENLTIAHDAVGVADVGPAVAQGLDLRPCEHDAR